MSIVSISNLRRVIPRWRDSGSTLTTGELFSFKNNQKKEGFDDSKFNEKILLWKNNKTIENASEILAESIIRGVNEEIINAAEFILSESPKKNKTLYSVAKEILTQSGELTHDNVNKTAIEIIDINYLRKQTHTIKRKLIEYPRNALMWVDLSRLYAMLGQLKQSKEAMNTGLIIGQDNRFVLRSAVRLFIHLEEPELAHSLLEKKEITRYDPWLMAAEIATASVAQKSSKFIKRGIAIIRQAKYSPFHLAELASALGTIELSSGSFRRAKKLLRFSLKSPTENSVAQSVWIKKDIPNLEVDNAIHATPRTYEAKALNALANQRWSEVVEETKLWMADESFSSRPAILGSYVAAIGLENYLLSEQLSRNGLIANSSDPTLINNLAFALANQGKLIDAREILDKIPLTLTKITQEVAITATNGLINFRQGKISEGKALYEKAISIATQSKYQKHCALAGVYYAREMLMAGEIDKNEAIILAENACDRINDADVMLLLSRIKEITQEKS